MRKNPVIKPFLKWAGGKRQLLPELTKYIDQKSFNKHTYYEPFIGGGALLFELQPTRAVISDKNKELINCYEVVKDSLDSLIKELRKYQEHNSADYFYKIRDLDRSPKYKNLSKVKRAARIIYLNKTCYNGLFRVNSQGQFNVPFGRYKKPNILDEAVLKAVSKYLNESEVKILNVDFAKAVKDAKKDDFIYFDPPYDPVSDTASFTGYDINGFNKDEQKRLKEVFDELTDRGCQVILSNSQTDFIMDLYQDYRDKIQVVRAARSINSKGLKRGKVDEILVLNFSV
ncbi:MAG: DNA adenine methylase [Okeania sp. SIO3I5]|uniref:DNA adenine methylase n=1 Tax=Okeania sp. SIO3I5 TaxID=2607805 RepID=UPI0013B7CB1F|nr:DNA adenine methylase [Okeania sp. SIO3I5]NEQ39002.1 DNA adenine methylase [Okeania sp. SIO3I5]